MQEAIKRKKNAVREMCKMIEKNKEENNLTRKIVSRAMKREAEQEINDLCDKPNNIFELVKFLKKEGQDVNHGQWFKGINGKLHSASRIERQCGKNIWKR